MANDEGQIPMRFFPYDPPEPGDEFLQPTGFLNFDDPTVRAFVGRVVGDAESDVQKAVRLFYAVRDEIRYDMYGISADPLRYTASDVLDSGAGYCIPKAVLLAAAARAAGIPALIGLSDVVNHFTTPKMEAMMGKDAVFLNHGYAGLYLDGKWVKAVPAFNARLCARMGVPPTEFDGKSDALLQEFDAERNLRMVYLRDHGYWSDLPLRRILDDFAGYYPVSLVDGLA